MGRLILLVALGLPMMFAAAELGVRQTQWRYLTVPRAPVFPSGIFQEDPVLEFDFATGKQKKAFEYRGPGHDISSNRWGCFDFDRGVGEDYILVVGGDAAWGYVDLKYHWATVLENETGARVVKCGVPGTGTAYHLEKAKRIIDEIGKPPSLVVLFYEPNDFAEDLVGERYRMVAGQRVSMVRAIDLETGFVDRHKNSDAAQDRQAHWQRRTGQGPLTLLLENSALLATGKYFYRKWKPPTKRATEVTDLQRADFYRRYKNRTWLNRELKTHLSAVENFHNMVSWNDSNLMLITDRFSFEGRGEPIRDFLESKRVPVFDVGRSVMAKSSKRNKKAYLDFYPYWNKRGNQYAGFAIADYIQQNGLLKP